tara:strand:+ start:1294 stop:1650 length:357 start_codon:yes stop_codon:yes gene_type:complete
MDKLSHDDLINVMIKMKMAYDNQIKNMKLKLEVCEDLLENDNEFDRKKIVDCDRCLSCDCIIKDVVHYGDDTSSYFADEIKKCIICSQKFCFDCVMEVDRNSKTFTCQLCNGIINIKL